MDGRNRPIESVVCGNMLGKRNPPEKGALIGRRVYLRPFVRDDLPHSQRWSEDRDIRTLIGEVTPMSDADAERLYEELRADKDRLWFIIMLKRGERVIGEAGLLRMFRPWRCADMTVIVGEKGCLGKRLWHRGRSSPP